MMVEEILHVSEVDDPTGLLVILGMLRDDFPWLYEIGLEVHRAIKGGSLAQNQEGRCCLSESSGYDNAGALLQRIT